MRRSGTVDSSPAGAAPRRVLAGLRAPRRLVERYGAEVSVVLAEAGGDPRLLQPLAEGVDVTGAEVLFAVRHEGALDADDVLDRRTRIGLVPAERDAALPCVRELLAGPATGGREVDAQVG